MLRLVKTFVTKLVVKLSLIARRLIEVGGCNSPYLVRGVRLRSKVTLVLDIGVRLHLHLARSLILDAVYAQCLLVYRRSVAFVTISYGLRTIRI